MKKYYLIFFTLFIYSSKIFSQKINFFSDVNIGFLSNQPLKDFHKELVDNVPFKQIKTTDNFSTNYGFNVGIKINTINTSFFFGYRVSGAKSSYSDFSGLIRLTNEVKGNIIGVTYEKDIAELGKGNILIGVRGLVTFSTLELISNTLLNNVQNDDKLNFSSTDIGAGLSFVYEVPITFFTLRAFVGFDAYLGGSKLNFDNIPNAHLLNNKGNKVTTGWTGINTGIGFSIPMFKN